MNFPSARPPEYDQLTAAVLGMRQISDLLVARLRNVAAGTLTQMDAAVSSIQKTLTGGMKSMVKSQQQKVTKLAGKVGTNPPVPPFAPVAQTSHTAGAPVSVTSAEVSATGTTQQAISGSNGGNAAGTFTACGRTLYNVPPKTPRVTYWVLWELDTCCPKGVVGTDQNPQGAQGYGWQGPFGDQATAQNVVNAGCVKGSTSIVCTPGTGDEDKRCVTLPGGGGGGGTGGGGGGGGTGGGGGGGGGTGGQGGGLGVDCPCGDWLISWQMPNGTTGIACSTVPWPQPGNTVPVGAAVTGQSQVQADPITGKPCAKTGGGGATGGGGGGATGGGANCPPPVINVPPCPPPVVNVNVAPGDLTCEQWQQQLQICQGQIVDLQIQITQLVTYLTAIIGCYADGSPCETIINNANTYLTTLNNTTVTNDTTINNTSGGREGPGYATHWDQPGPFLFGADREYRRAILDFMGMSDVFGARNISDLVTRRMAFAEQSVGAIEAEVELVIEPIGIQ